MQGTPVTACFSWRTLARLRNNFSSKKQLRQKIAIISSDTPDAAFKKGVIINPKKNYGKGNRTKTET